MKSGAFLGALLAAAGCSYQGSARSFDPEALDSSKDWVVVRNVPIHLQEEEIDCGIAALSMVLEYWRIDQARERIKESCPILEEKGTRARDLRDCARKAGLQSYLVHGSWDDLDRELRLGHPVIVGMVKSHTSGALTHYEVVVGLHPKDQVILTLDPAHGWRKNNVDGFLMEWEATGRLMLVFFPHVKAPPPLDLSSGARESVPPDVDPADRRP